jgi:hypothetical protein
MAKEMGRGEPGTECVWDGAGADGFGVDDGRDVTSGGVASKAVGGVPRGIRSDRKKARER